MGKFGPVFTPNAQKWANLGFRAFFYPKYTEILTLIGVLGPFFFLPKTHRNGQMGFLGPFFTQNTQKWANLGLFLPQMLRNGQIWVLGPFFSTPKYTEMVKFGFGGLFFSKTHRNGSVWVFGPIFPQEHSEMGKFGF